LQELDRSRQVECAGDVSCELLRSAIGDRPRGECESRELQCFTRQHEQRDAGAEHPQQR
jgi:hypothetical protein